MKLLLTILLILCLGSVAFANDPDWNGDPEPPKVEEPAPMPDAVDGDSAYDPYSRIYYAICTCDKMKVAWGFESLELRTNKARMQCEQLRIRKSCPEKWK